MNDWETEDPHDTEYLRLARDLLGEDNIRHAAIPVFDWQTSFESEGKDNKWIGDDFPGGVDAATEQRLAIAVGLSPVDWSRLAERERIPWLEKALAEGRKVPAGEESNGAELLSDDDDLRIRERIMEVVESDQSVDAKMRAICSIDISKAGWSSTRWGKLLGVSAAAIRKTDFWKQLQEQRKRPD